MVNAHCLRVLFADLFFGAVVTGCHPMTSPQDAPSVLNFGPHTVIIYSILARRQIKPSRVLGWGLLCSVLLASRRSTASYPCQRRRTITRCRADLTPCCCPAWATDKLIFEAEVFDPSLDALNTHVPGVDHVGMMCGPTHPNIQALNRSARIG